MLSYDERAELKLKELTDAGQAVVLAIESSCDETAAAVVKNGRQLLSNSVYTQIPLHRRYGGVVPELASRNHVEQIGSVVSYALDEAGMSLDSVDAVAVTCGPGLVGALLVGVSFAKALVLSHGLPLIGTHHIMGHIAANYLSFAELVPPFICLVASGGHSEIVEVVDYDHCRLIGSTRDDAAGEAFDKIARVLGLPYPGGPELERLAKSGDPKAFRFHSAFNEGSGYDMSFSGLKTAVIQLMHNAEQRGETISRADVAASFQFAVCNILTEKAVRAAKAYVSEGGKPALALAGGVSANSCLRQMLRRSCEKSGIAFYCPDLKYCTDNAAMIGSAGFYLLMKGHRSGLDLNATPYLKLY